MKTHEYRKTVHCIIYHGKFEPGNQDLKHGVLNRLLNCLHQKYGWIIKVPYIIAPGLYVEDDIVFIIVENFDPKYLKSFSLSYN